MANFANAEHPYMDFSSGEAKLKDGYSFVAHQDAPDPVHTSQSKTSRKGGGFTYGEKRHIYKKVETKAAPTKTEAASNASNAPDAAAAKPKPKPKDDMVIKQRPDKDADKRSNAKEKAQAYKSSSFKQKYGEQDGAVGIGDFMSNQFSGSKKHAKDGQAPDSFQSQQRGMDMSKYQFNPGG